MLERTATITRSSKCSETGRSETILRSDSRAVQHPILTYSSQKEAISYSWELLTQVYKLSPDRLYVTYFEGDASNGLPPDLEAKQFWLDVGISEHHIVPGSAKDNFWGDF